MQITEHANALDQCINKMDYGLLKAHHGMMPTGARSRYLHLFLKAGALGAFAGVRAGLALADLNVIQAAALSISTVMLAFVNGTSDGAVGGRIIHSSVHGKSLPSGC